jgi:CheY-like chemotaxis protein
MTPVNAIQEQEVDSVSWGKILLVEDNESNVITIQEYLSYRGYEVVVAQNGAEATDMAEKFSPDIILMDIQMPKVNGSEAIRRLRADSRFDPTPIIALTALAMPGDRERCLEAGANEYLSKPVSLKMLVKTIDDLLRIEKE